MRRDPPINRTNHIIPMRLHHRIVKPQKPDTQIFQPPLPLNIRVSFQCVAFAVYLDREHQFSRKEIHDVFVDRPLAVEIMTPLASAQT
jgi:hypothetical protein